MIKPKRYKVLMHQDKFVDYDLIGINLQYTKTPKLFPSMYNIENVRRTIIDNERYPKYKLENLRKCKLVEVELKIVE